ncbi:MAG: hypothetical protein ABI700_25040, partial [Chloroflexota bacterium]
PTTSEGVDSWLGIVFRLSGRETVGKQAQITSNQQSVYSLQQMPLSTPKPAFKRLKENAKVDQIAFWSRYIIAQKFYLSSTLMCIEIDTP